MSTVAKTFRMQGGMEIEYNGKTVHRVYNFNKKGTYLLRITFVKSNSEFPQGIKFYLDEFEGKIFIEGKEEKKKKTRFPQILFSEEYSPKQFEVTVQLEDGYLTICNTSSVVENIWFSVRDGCGMIMETIAENHLRFHCNDHVDDDDFDDLIFELEFEKID